MGFVVGFNKSKEMVGVRIASKEQKSRLIRGLKADYSPRYFKVVGGCISAKSSDKVIDILAR